MDFWFPRKMQLNIPVWMEGPQRVLQWTRFRRHVLIGVIFATFVLIFFATQHSPVLPDVIRGEGKAASSPNLLHLLVPANRREQHLCKNILSSTINGYPIPVIINWGKVFNNTRFHNAGSHIAKIRGFLDYLEALDASQQNDLVLLVDGYDTWFQLDSTLLVSRYNAINAAANKRIRSDVGDQITVSRNIRQTIIFSSQKKCWPGKSSDVWCWAIPPAQLPEDTYGPDTDTDIDDGSESYVFARYRQRYLNSGIVMGPAGDLRKMFERAEEMSEADETRGSDQGIFAEIFGIQEFQRTLLKEQWQLKRSESEPWWRRLFGVSHTTEGLKQASVQDRHPTHRNPILHDGKDYDFGIGLDYFSELGQPTVFSDLDMDWITYKDTEGIHAAWEKGNVSNPRSDVIQADLATRPWPFSILNSPFPANTASHRNKFATWEDVQLFTNMWTGVTPVVIHHNAHRDGLKSNRDTMWKEIWFQPYARELLSTRLRESGRKSGAGNRLQVADRPAGFALRTDESSTPWIEWNDLCDEGIQEEVFRDGKGVFVLGEQEDEHDYGASEEEQLRQMGIGGSSEDEMLPHR
ncbi:MAG: hypothetical protein Q9164_003727 [Protoblastenia rupestris]